LVAAGVYREERMQARWKGGGGGREGDRGEVEKRRNKTTLREASAESIPI